VIQSEEHECKEEDIKTWEELKKSTRPCPKCNVRIYKINGCDQMWCVHCNTAFSWRRGTIEYGSVHNPHYFDWLFKGGVAQAPAQGEGDCNENVFPSAMNLQIFLRNNHFSETDTNSLFRLYRFFLHFANVDIPKFQPNLVQSRSSTFDYLTRHLKGEKNIDKLFERFLLREQLHGEFATILENYKQQQIHYFRALLGESLSYTDFLEKTKDLNRIYKSAIRQFNSFYKTKYSVSLNLPFHT
jgi:hypothetical protein